MESVLQGLKGVSIYLDDIVNASAAKEEHVENLNKVVERLVAAGLHFKKSKCSFMRAGTHF